MAPYSMDLRKRVLRAWDAGRAADRGGVEHPLAGDRSVAVDRQKKPYTPTNNDALTSSPRAAAGRRGCHSGMCASTCSSTSVG